ncbi:hypothetical protein BC834DRAFT_902909 [Gloeopeniophorella convolvens]|nr:hypothetical protein BC834DRAFT_902909 [Gloeopeniophorella convolvens]
MASIHVAVLWTPDASSARHGGAASHSSRREKGEKRRAKWGSGFGGADIYSYIWVSESERGKTGRRRSIMVCKRRAVRNQIHNQPTGTEQSRWAHYTRRRRTYGLPHIRASNQGNTIRKSTVEERKQAAWCWTVRAHAAAPLCRRHIVRVLRLGPRVRTLAPLPLVQPPPRHRRILALARPPRTLAATPSAPRTPRHKSETTHLHVVSALPAGGAPHAILRSRQNKHAIAGLRRTARLVDGSFSTPCPALGPAASNTCPGARAAACCTLGAGYALGSWTTRNGAGCACAWCACACACAWCAWPSSAPYAGLLSGASYSCAGSVLTGPRASRGAGDGVSTSAWPSSDEPLDNSNPAASGGAA